MATNCVGKDLIRFFILSLALAGGETAQADPRASSPHELIIKMRQSTRPSSSAIEFARELKFDSNSRLLKLSFSTLAQRQWAVQRLEQREDVERIQANHYYRPSLRLMPGPGLFKNASKGLIESLMMADIPAVLEPWIGPRGPDPFLENDWAYRAIHMPEEARLTRLLSATQPVTVALIDTGIDYNHEDLSASLWRDPQDSSVVGWDVLNQNARPYDVVHFDMEGCQKDPACKSFIHTSEYLVNPGHGTHCAGHIGAVANNSRGIRGAAFGAARIMTLKFIYGAGEGVAGAGDDFSIVAAIDWAVNHGARILSISWGGRQTRAEAENSEFKRALLRARDAGVLIVAAAGNDGINLDTDNLPSYPAAFDLDNLLVVAAIDQTNKMPEFSSYGPRAVHLAAPGVRVFSTVPGSHYASTVARYQDDSGNVRELFWDGTSMAAPMVAGAAALLWSTHPNENYLQIKNRILRAVRPIRDLQGKVQSGGILDVERSLK